MYESVSGRTYRCEKYVAMKNKMPDIKLASPFYRDYIKRILDLTIAIPVLMIAAVSMIITAIAVKRSLRGSGRGKLRAACMELQA